MKNVITAVFNNKGLWKTKIYCILNDDNSENATCQQPTCLFIQVILCLTSQSCCTGRSYGVQVDWMDSTTEEVALWRRMMNSPNEWVEDIFPLRMITAAKNTWK